MYKIIGYDIDGVLTSGVLPVGNCVVISGRTFGEYDDFAKKIASSIPVYIRGVGKYGDRRDAGEFKSKLISMLDVSEFYEDDPLQIEIIKSNCPNCKIIKV